MGRKSRVEFKSRNASTPRGKEVAELPVLGVIRIHVSSSLLHACRARVLNPGLPYYNFHKGMPLDHMGISAWIANLSGKEISQYAVRPRGSRSIEYVLDHNIRSAEYITTVAFYMLDTRCRGMSL